MLQLSRAQVRVLRAVLRHTLLSLEPRGEWPLLLCQSGGKGLTIQAHKGDLAVGFHQPGKQPEATLAFRSSLLAEFEGRKDDPVELQQVALGQGKATWTEAGVPRILELETEAPDKLPPFPKIPRRSVPMPATFVGALAEAAKTTASENVRYTLTKIQLRGREGQVVATDGYQLLLHGGFSFPWSDNVLIPVVTAFGRKDLLPHEPVRLGGTDSHLTIWLGPWLFLMHIDRNSRFPDTATVLPNPKAVTCRLQFDPGDAKFLKTALMKLPGSKDAYAPITLDLEAKPKVRAKAQDAQTITEVELSQSAVEGQALRVCCNRHYLQRALELGFPEVLLTDPKKPFWCRDEQRLYLWIPVDPKYALKPTGDMLRITTAQKSSTIPSNPTKQRRNSSMPSPANNGRQATGVNRPAQPQDSGNDLADLISEAEELRKLVQETGSRLSRLIANLKQQRRQNRAVRAAVASLQQLNLDG